MDSLVLSCSDCQQQRCSNAYGNPSQLWRFKQGCEPLPPPRFRRRLHRHSLKQALGKISRRLFASKCLAQFVIKAAHNDTSPNVRLSLSLKTARERRKWLLTVLSGISSTLEISAGSRSSW